MGYFARSFQDTGTSGTPDWSTMPPVSGSLVPGSTIGIVAATAGGGGPQSNRARSIT